MSIQKPSSRTSTRIEPTSQAAPVAPQAAVPASARAVQDSPAAAREPAAPLESRDDRLARLMDLRQSRAESRRVGSDPGGRQVLEYADSEGNQHRDVRALDEAGRLVQARTMIQPDGVVTEVSRTTPEGIQERWVIQDSFRDDRLDRSFHTMDRYAKTPGGDLDWSKKTPGAREIVPTDEVFRKRAELFAARGRGVEEKLGGLTFSAGFNSSVTLSSGTGPDGQPANLLLAQGAHGAGPFPGAHWDEASLVVMDGQYGKKLALSIDPKDEKTHLNVRFEKTQAGGEPAAALIYEGYMVDEQGKRHHVESRFLLREHEVKLANPGLWGKIYDNTVGVALEKFSKVWGLEENAKILTELPCKLSGVKIDGREYKIDRSITSLDDNAKFNNMFDTPLLAGNYAPEGTPLLSLLDPKEMESRRRYNSTFLVDQKEWLNELPDFLKKGTMANHVLTDAAGNRRDAKDGVQPDGPPLATREYTFQWDGKPIATMTKDLVRYRDAKGNVELGYRETIRATPEYQAYLDSL